MLKGILNFFQAHYKEEVVKDWKCPKCHEKAGGESIYIKTYAIAPFYLNKKLETTQMYCENCGMNVGACY